ncbi:MAG: VOC family protein [Limnochordia bacterium]|jgi:glyoxylase I family protein
MIRGIEHFGLMAKDPERLARWYADVLDFRIVFQIGSPPKVFIAGREKGMIEIIPWEEDVAEEKGKRTHIAIEVTDFQKALERLQRVGVTVEEMRDTFAGGRVAFFRDIEDNLLHFVYRPEPVWELD